MPKWCFSNKQNQQDRAIWFKFDPKLNNKREIKEIRAICFLSRNCVLIWWKASTQKQRAIPKLFESSILCWISWRQKENWWFRDDLWICSWTECAQCTVHTNFYVCHFAMFSILSHLRSARWHVFNGMRAQPSKSNQVSAFSHIPNVSNAFTSKWIANVGAIFVSVKLENGSPSRCQSSHHSKYHLVYRL